LAELLIALGILAVIATFSIPKILMSQQTSKKKAVLRETISALNEAFVPACLAGEITEGTFGTYMRSHLNAVKICTTNSMSQGCWYGTDLVGQSATPGVIMHNGAVIAGLDNDVSGGGTDTLMVDWDGPGSTNLHADDQIVLRAFITDASSSDRVCTIRWDPMHTASRTMWLNTFDAQAAP
jgi:hypothetical protein